LTAIEWIVIIFAGLGTLFSFFAALGLVRLPDVYSRLHSAGKSATGGVAMSILAVLIFFLYQQELFIVKLLLVILFVFLTTPIVSLSVARSAYHTGVELEKNAICDELKEKYEMQNKD